MFADSRWVRQKKNLPIVTSQPYLDVVEQKLTELTAINRGLEIASEVADGDRSLILEQVTNGIAVRMSIMAKLMASQSGPE